MLEPSSVGLAENNEIENLTSLTKLFKQFLFKLFGTAEGDCDC